MLELALLLVALGFLTVALAFWRLSQAVIGYGIRGQPDQGPHIEAPMIPVLIQNLIDMESETWAKQDLEIQALQLFEDHKDWNKVHSTLLEVLGDPHDVAGRAWDVEPVATEADGEPIAEGF